MVMISVVSRHQPVVSEDEVQHRLTGSRIQKPTVGQAHRILFARANLSTEIPLAVLTLLISKPRYKFLLSTANFEIENRRVRNRQISL